ncbi:MAG: peptidylprolyl isomerase [Planctomycetes bacterium RBG_16_59_8]|nr:MAG: peptidylprolyl isomerase [Planctomycetes bacterium RBG_16_59_8]
MKFLIFFSTIVLLTVGCSKSEPVVSEGGDVKPSNRSAPEKPAEPAVVETGTGLKYQELVVGNGNSPQAGQTVVVHYTGRLEDGRKFDSSVDRGEPFDFIIGMGRVIKGWDEGLATMKVGGKRKLIIPPYLGYGALGAGGVIQPNATLIFEVEILEIR